MTTLRAIVSIAALLTWGTVRTFAHGDVHDRIVLLTKQMEQMPKDASLFFQRAKLYRVDGDYKSALTDLDQTILLESGLPRVQFCRGRVPLESGQFEAALEPLNRYLVGQPKDAEAYAARARALIKLQRPRLATEDYTTALATSSGNPELHIERAEAWRAAGRPEESIRGLDEGIRALGPLVTL